MTAMRKWWRHAAVGAIVALFAACSDPAAEDGLREVAGELRALRVELQAKAATPPGAPAPAAFEPAKLAEAMAPLREILTALVRDMADMQTRQAALTQELQRWSQLLAQSVAEGHKAEATALQQRIDQLEADLQRQAARQRQAEGLMSDALDRTSQKIEDFLKRLEGTGGGGQAQPGNGQGDPTGGQANAGGGGAATEPSVQPQPGNRPSARRRGASPWWYVLGVFGLGAGGWFALWLRRENTAARREAAGSSAADDGARELWAAAALLGEAVGRLRQQEAEGAAQPEGAAAKALPAPQALVAAEPQTEPATPAVEPPPADHEVDEVFVLEDFDFDAEPPAAATAPATPPPVANPRRDAAPAELEFHLPCREPRQRAAAVLAVALRDPRVLRRPVPIVLPEPYGVHVRCAVLPTLSPGQRGHLELRLRAAAAG